MASFAWAWFQNCLSRFDVRARQEEKRLEIEREIHAQEEHVAECQRKTQALTADRDRIIQRVIQRTREEHAKRRQPFDPKRDPAKPTKDEHRQLLQCTQSLKRAKANERHHQTQIDNLAGTLDLGRTEELDKGTKLSIEYMELSSQLVVGDAQRRKMLERKTQLEERLQRSRSGATQLVATGDLARQEELAQLSMEEAADDQRLQHMEEALGGLDSAEPSESDPLGWSALYIEASTAVTASALADDDNA